MRSSYAVSVLCCPLLTSYECFCPKPYTLFCHIFFRFQVSSRTSDPFCPTGSAPVSGFNRFEDDFLGPKGAQSRGTSDDAKSDSSDFDEDDDDDVNDDDSDASTSSSHPSTIKSGQSSLLERFEPMIHSTRSGLHC